MAERRALIEGLADAENIDIDLAEEFITHGKLRKAAKTSTQAPEDEKTRGEPAAAMPSLPQSLVLAQQPAASPLTGVGRVPVGARVRTELAAALKRASLERQLRGVEPNSVQEILEESLELWLHKHGHLN